MTQQQTTPKGRAFHFFFFKGEKEAVFFEHVNVMKDKEKLRNCSG